MAFKANYEFLFVGRDDNSFLENYAYDLFQEHGDKSGQIFINLEVQNNPVDAEEIGQAIFETMQKVFFEDVGRDPYERFEGALKAINGVLGEFKSQKASGYIGNLNVIITAIVGDTLYLTQTGDAEMYMARKRYISVISEGLSDEISEDGDVFTNIASGSIESGDFILTASARLLRYISKTDLAKALSGKDVVANLDEVRDVISTEMLGRIGLTGIRFDEATVADVESVENDVDTATRTVLEASEDHVSSEKKSITGKFITAFKGYRRKKNEVYQGGGGGSFFSGLLEKVGGFFKGLFSGGFGKDKIFAALVLMIVVLMVAIFVAKSNMANMAELEKLDSVLISVQEKIAEAETKGSYDKDKAKEILAMAYDDAMTVLNSGQYRDKAIFKLNEIDVVRDKLDNVNRIEEPIVYADLTSKEASVDALGFVEVGDRFFVFESNALYELVLDQIQDPLTIDDEETVIAATGFDDRNSVLFLTKSGKFIEYKNGTMAFMDTDDGVFRKGVEIEDWSNKIYLLDPVSSQIWKYTYKGTRDRFGGAEAYLGDDEDFSNAVDLAIDGSVYMLKADGDVNKFYSGNKVDFYINDAPFNAFKDPAAIYTNGDLDEVYILDSEEARVLVFLKDSKSGNIVYKSQYLFDGVGELRDVYVDATDRKLYVLGAQKVYEVAL